NFQKSGSFKIRGATNAVLSLSDIEASHGVITHSSGNHAGALALAAGWRNIAAHVVMPRNTIAPKRDAAAEYGAEIVFCTATLADRERTLTQVLEYTNAEFIHPYNDLRIITGQATAALELCREIPGLDAVIAPVGGGGLLSGTAIAVSAVSPGTRIFGAEPEQANDAWQSFQMDKLILVQNPATIADGLRTSLGTLTFPLIKKYVTDIMTVSEAAIITAMRTVWERMKIIIEPSAAVPLAAAMSGSHDLKDKRLGIILSGGNADCDQLPWNIPHNR
ncbi:MAG: pyridoxal-phosphate dependent enzyme, partial [Deltaproteobacteria bacterium]|nr:pyridoxal-phosphate dependent enzyme [Deltaproteobacteria bacterium]